MSTSGILWSESQGEGGLREEELLKEIVVENFPTFI